MFNYIWPVIVAVLSSIIYQICAKSLPEGINPLASITATYLVGAVVSAILYYILTPGANIIREYSNFNIAPYALGIVIVGLDVGSIYGYRAGWSVSTQYIVHSACASVLLLFVGYLLYKEGLSWNKILGTVICLVGLVFINIK